MTLQLSCGSPEPLGVTPDAAGVNVAVFSRHAEKIEFCLFDAADCETARVALPERTGDVHHGFIAGVRPGDRYGLRADGPFEPHAGHRFNANKLLVDPYALRLDRPFTLHAAMSGFPPGADDLAFDATDSAPHVPKAIVEREMSARADPEVGCPWDKTILYELHLRAYTLAHPAVPAPQQGTFAGLAHPAVVAHLKSLGVTTVEIMPAAAWIDERHLPPLGLRNSWGYNPIALCAPDPRLAPGGWAEVRACVDAYHTAGLEVILDVVFNHSGESDELGPTLSMRGLDNASYYRLRPDQPRYYVNDTGCGNVLALDRAPMLRLTLDALRTWARLGGVDGFRFDLAATMGRRAQGFDAAAPVLAAIEQDPALRRLKLIAEPWDIGPGGYQLGAFSASWAEWSDRSRDDFRKFWRGDAHALGPLATRLAGSADIFAAKRRPSRGVNFIAAHDGFTLADLVSYSHKRNEANGESNRDGTNENHSWNHGVEGPSADPGVRAARERDQRNLLATLLLARGAPMLSMGCELGHSQGGNNNAYAQDFAVEWGEATFAGLIAALTRLRTATPALRDDRFLTGAGDVAWLRADGGEMAGADWSAPNADMLIARLSTPARYGEPASRALVILNRGGADREIALPEGQWRLALDTAQSTMDGYASPGSERRLTIARHSVVVLVEPRS